MKHNEHFLDPSVLAKIDNFSLIAKTVVEGFIVGLHRSLYHGFGSEFVHYRQYTHGDDLKYIDWKVYARSNTFQLKIFQEETNSNVYIIVDSSASMAYQGTKSSITKLHLAKTIAACIAYLSLRQGDKAGFYAYDETLRCCIPPRHNPGHLQQIFTQLTRMTPQGRGNHAEILPRLAEMFRRRGIIVFISDFLDTDSYLKQALRYFKVAHHDCILLHVLDEDETDFPFEGNVRFLDSESGSSIDTVPHLARNDYLESFQCHLRDLKEGCTRQGIDYVRVFPTKPLENVLATYLHKRQSFR